MSNCNVPDLDLLPAQYPSLHTIRFYAGLELPLLHIGLWGVSWLARWKLIRNYRPFASLFRTISLWFYRFGTDAGGMHIAMCGEDKAGNALSKTWYLIARNGDGPEIPSTPAVILADKIRNKILDRGAYPAVGLISRAELAAQFRAFTIEEIIS